MEFSLEGKFVAVLAGGPGREREVSIRSAAAVARALESKGAKVEVVDVAGPDFVVPDGADFAYNMIHGTFGEDGQIQAILDSRGIPYTGDGEAASRLAFDKVETKKRFEVDGVPTAWWMILRQGDTIPELKIPVVMKSPREGSSVSVEIIRDAADVLRAVESCFGYGDEILVEDYVAGRELTVGILGDRALPVIEIVPHSEFYDFEHKYTQGGSDYFCPADLDADTTTLVQNVALAAHRSLGLEIYSRVDVLLDADGRPFVLEANTIPGMTETSLLPKAAAAVGISFADLCAEIARLSLTKRGGDHR